MKTMHRFNRILILWTFLGVLHVTNGIDVGFEFQYTTNKEEHLDHPVRFERPLPEWLKGVYMRNGPGQYSMGSRHLEHAFDGYAKPHNIRFQGDGASTAYYTTRFIRSKYYLDSADIHDVKPSMLMLQPSPSFSWIESMLGFVSGFDNMDVNIYNYSGEFVAMSDFWPIYVLNHTNIDTIRRVFADIPTVYFTMNALPYPSSAHPMPEIGTTNYISYVSIPSFVGKTRFIVIRIKSADEREYITEFKMDRLYYVHSFAATEHFAVFFLGPVYTDLWSAFNSWQSLLSIKWAEDEPTQVKVVDLRTGAVQSFKTKALFLSHHANAWEVDDNTIVADGVFYPSDAVFSFRVLKTLHNKTLRDKMEADTAILLRHTIRLGQEGSIKMEALPALPEHRFMNHMEYPIINEAFRYKENRYLYGTVLKSDFRVLGNQTLIKRDLKDPRNNLVWMRANHFPHETWFVPRPGATREDDGILLCDILDGEKKLSYTAVFNATTMELINKGYHPTWNSWTFHGRLFH